MIKFFRKIRKNLLIENKTGKYFKYAIGEIVLVVIGILIALQIGDYNESRKRQEFSKEILKLIDQNLQQDSIALKEEFDKALKAVQLTDSLLYQVSKLNYSEQLNNWMGKIITFERFKSQSSAFEVLKAKGIDIITNNKLQLDLISYYDKDLFAVYESLNDVEKAFNADWVPIIKTDFIDFEWMNSVTPTNPKEFFKKPSTIILFKMFKDNRKGSLWSLNRSIKKITEIRSKIKMILNDKIL
jgi:hypothetical protein